MKRGVRQARCVCVCVCCDSAKAGSLAKGLQTTSWKGGQQLPSPDSEKLHYPKGSRPPVLSADKWEPSLLWPTGAVQPQLLTEALGGLHSSCSKWFQGKSTAAGWCSKGQGWEGRPTKWRLASCIPSPGALNPLSGLREITQRSPDWPSRQPCQNRPPHHSMAMNWNCASKTTETVGQLSCQAVLNALGATG